MAALRRADSTSRSMKRCEEKIRYGTAASAQVVAVAHPARPLPARAVAPPRAARVRVSASRRVAPHVAAQADAMNDASTD